jgi:hypothetical protein
MGILDWGGCQKSWTWTKVSVRQTFKSHLQSNWEETYRSEKLVTGDEYGYRITPRTREEPQGVPATKKFQNEISQRMSSAILMSSMSISCQVEQDRVPTVITPFSQGNA